MSRDLFAQLAINYARYLPNCNTKLSPSRMWIIYFILMFSGHDCSLSTIQGKSQS